jgi:ketosteroid isomerase-like protein
MHANEELVRHEAAAWDAGDQEAIVAHYGPEAVIHVPRDNPLAGECRGHEGVREYHRKVSELLGSLDDLNAPVHAVLANDEHVVRLIQITCRKGDQEVEWRHIEVYHVRDGKLDRVWKHVDPQRDVDAFLTHIASRPVGDP